MQNNFHFFFNIFLFYILTSDIGRINENNEIIIKWYMVILLIEIINNFKNLT
jgi:hypothetical protein